MQNNIEALIEYFIDRKVLTLPEIMKILETTSRMTAARKLLKIGGINSYTHRGSYYTLSVTPNFDDNGLWSFRDIFFSRFGTLYNTVTSLIKESKMGYFASELDEITHTGTANSLTKLTKDNIIRRQQLNSRFLYLWPTKANEQLQQRKKTIYNELKLKETGILDQDTSLKIFLSVLNEKQKRLFLGYESIRLGVGGDLAVSLQTGMDRKTVAKGRRELLDGNVTIERIRKAGAGRPALKKTKF